MAKAMGLDKSYLSQLENGRRPVDEFYVARAADIEKSNLINAQQVRESTASYSDDSIQQRCHRYLSSVLEECRHDEDRLRWTFVELQRHFPLKESRPPAPPLSSARQSAVEATASSHAGAAQQIALESERRQRAAVTSGDKPAPGGGVGRAKK